MRNKYHTTTTTITRTVHAQYSCIWGCWQIQVDTDTNGNLHSATHNLPSLIDIVTDRETAYEFARLLSTMSAI